MKKNTVVGRNALQIELLAEPRSGGTLTVQAQGDNLTHDRLTTAAITYSMRCEVHKIISRPHSESSELELLSAGRTVFKSVNLLTTEFVIWTVWAFAARLTERMFLESTVSGVVQVLFVGVILWGEMFSVRLKNRPALWESHTCVKKTNKTEKTWFFQANPMFFVKAITL